MGISVCRGKTFQQTGEERKEEERRDRLLTHSKRCYDVVLWEGGREKRINRGVSESKYGAVKQTERERTRKEATNGI